MIAHSVISTLVNATHTQPVTGGDCFRVRCAGVAQGAGGRGECEGGMAAIYTDSQEPTSPGHICDNTTTAFGTPAWRIYSPVADWHRVTGVSFRAHFRQVVLARGNNQPRPQVHRSDQMRRILRRRLARVWRGPLPRTVTAAGLRARVPRTRQDQRRSLQRSPRLHRSGPHHAHRHSGPAPETAIHPPPVDSPPSACTACASATPNLPPSSKTASCFSGNSPKARR